MTDALEGFVCQRCGACCRIDGGIVRVGDAEIAAMAAFLGEPEADFIERWTELAPDRRGLMLKSEPDGTCCFYREGQGCVVHPVKPGQCRTFPFRWRNPDSQELCPALRALNGTHEPHEPRGEGGRL